MNTHVANTLLLEKVAARPLFPSASLCMCSAGQWIAHSRVSAQPGDAAAELRVKSFSGRLSPRRSKWSKLALTLWLASAHD